MFKRPATSRVPRRPALLLRKLEDRILFDAAPGVVADVPQVDFQQPSETTQSLDATADPRQVTRHEMLFVDPTVRGYESLVDDVLHQADANRTLELVLLDADSNGVEQISAALGRAANINAVHIVSHADEAAFRLGNEWVTADNLGGHARQIASWKGGLAQDADLLIYGCDLSGTPAGQSLARDLSELTGADVASSTDDTGQAALGGDWDLEHATGPIETASAFSEAAQSAFVGLLAVGPDVQVNLPAEAMIGGTFSFTATFRNSGSPGEVGYGPFVDLLFPVNGTDGAAGTDTPDGIDFTSATYLGAAVTATELVFPDAGGGIGTVNHPYAVDNTGAPLQISGTAGDKLVVLQLPFGSFTPEQPDAILTISASLSDHADLGVPLSVAARAGFQYGADALNNPATDPSILSDIQTDSSAWVVNDAVTPTLMTVTKTYVGPENETATGPNYPRQYQLNIELADGQTVTDLDVIDQLPDNVVVTAVNSVTPAGTTNPVGFPYGPVNPLPGNELSINFPTVTGGAGTDAQVIFTFYVAEFDASGGRVIPLDGEDDTTSSPDSRSRNNVRAVGDWAPIDPRDLGGTDNAVSDPDPLNPEHTLDDKSIAIQKSVAVVSGGPIVTPDDVLEYTLSFQISDYHTFGDLIITDTFQDGQLFDFGFDAGGNLDASFTITDFNGTVAGGFTTRRSTDLDAGETLVVDETLVDLADNAAENPATDGSTTLTFDLSQALIDHGAADGILQGGLSNGAINLGPATGTITFRTVIQDDFADTFPSGDRSVDQGDAITNTDLTVDGSVRQNAEDGSIAIILGNESDSSSSEVTIASGTLSKDIVAINGNTTLPLGPSGLVGIAPGDVVTYRLEYTLPSSDFEDLILTDYLPLPVFAVTDPDADNIAGPAWSFNLANSFDAIVPVPGEVEFGPNDTFYNSRPGFSDTTSAPDFFSPPQLSTDPVANSLKFLLGDYDDPLHQPTVIELYFSVAVQNDPFADGLFLTNIVRAEEGTTNQGAQVIDQIVQIELTEPNVRISKGVVSTTKDGLGATYSAAVGPAGITFAAPGFAGAPFSGGTINSSGLAIQDLDADVTDGLDADDLVRFAILIENTGNSRSGAFDVQIQDTLAAGLSFVPGSLQVVDGTGATMGFTDVNAGNPGLFGDGIEITDPGPTPSLADGSDSGALDAFDATDGRNLAIVFYDAQLQTSLEPGATVSNTATLGRYANQEGGPDFTTTDPQDSATATLVDPAISKSLLGTEIVNANNANNRAVIGEIITYELVIDVPEGTMTGFQVRDLLDAGLAFMDGDADTIIDATIVASAGLSTSVGTFSDVVNGAVVTNSGAGPVNQGRLATFDFGTVTNSNTDDATTERITITYDAVVVNGTSNNAGSNRNNAATLTWSNGSLGDSAANVTILEPLVDVQKSASVTVADVGNPITFTIVVTNQAGANRTDAYDVSLEDILPTGFTFAGNLSHAAGLAPTTLGEAGGTVSATWAILGLGQTSTISFDVTVDAAFSPPGQTNAANIEWTSLPGPETTPRSTFNPLSVERTGDPTDPAQAGAINDYNDGASAFVGYLLVPSKLIRGTSEVHTSDVTLDTIGDPRPVAIGEVVTYELRTQVGEGALTGVTVRDFLTAGMTLLPATATFEIVSDSAMTVAGDLTGANAAPIVLPVGRIAVTPGATQLIDFALGDITNHDSDPDAELLVITFDALTSNLSVNNDGVQKTNTFQFIENGVSRATSNVLFMEIQEPAISNVDKRVVTVNATGDQVSYRVTFSNTGSTTAFDVQVLDNLPVELTLHIPSISVSAAAVVDTTNSTASALDVRLDRLAAGDSVTVDYTVDAVFAGSGIQNDASVTYTSLPGTNGTASATPGLPGADDGERIGILADPVDDYLDADTALVGSIGDRLWYDIDGDGFQDVGEPGLPGVVVDLTWFGPNGLPGGGDDVLMNTVTDAAGNYEFAALPPGNFLVSVNTATLPNGLNQPTFDLDGIGTPHTVTTSLSDDLAGIQRADVDFGYTGRGSIGDTVWLDYDESATQNAGEPGIAAVDITLTWEGFLPGFGDGDEVTYLASTNASGNYDVTNLPAGQFLVDVDPTTVDLNQDLAPDIVVLTTANDPSTVNLAIGQDYNLADFGYRGTGLIGDTVWLDVDGDGTQNGTEPGYPGLAVTLDMDFDGNGIVDYSVSTTTDASGNYLFSNLPPGNYEVTVTPPANVANTGDPDGGADSRSTIILADGASNVSQDFGYQGTGSIGDRVWLDLDGDGAQAAGEPGIRGSNVRLDIDLDGDGAPELSVTTATDASGNYVFSNLPAGDYNVTVLNPLGGTTPTSDADGTATPHSSAVTLSPLNPNDAAQDFGYQGTGSIGDTVYWDADNNGSRDVGEPGLPGIPVALAIDFDQNGTVDATLNAITDANGNYSFSGLPAVDYELSLTQPVGTTQTEDPDGGNDNLSTLTLAAGENNAAQDFGYRGNGSIGDSVFFDANNNALQDAGDLGLPGVDVRLEIDVNGDTLVDYSVLASTDIDGNYLFTNLIPGDYTVRINPATVPGGMGANPTFDSDGIASAHVAVLTLGVSEDNVDQDFGYTGTASLGDFVWLDTNANGAQDAAEPGLANVDITATWFGPDAAFGTGDDEVFTMTTDAAGFYDFTNLPSGDYRVDVDQGTAPGNTSLTTANDTHDVNLSAGQDHDASDFGFASPGAIGDFVFFDADGDGSYNPLIDAAYPGVIVTLTGDIDGDAIDETFVTTTDASGNYNFPGLPFADYTVALTAPAGTSPTFDADGTATPNSSDISLDTITPSSNAQDFGLTGTGSVGDTIFYDIDGDGTQAGTEPGIPGVAVRLEFDLDGNGTPDYSTTTITDATGNYSFTGIPQGTPTVTVTPPSGATPTSDLDGDFAADSDHRFPLLAGENNLSEDFGFLGTGSIGDVVYWDANNNGAQDAGEPGLPGVPVTLEIDFDGNGSVDQTLNTTTDASGGYSFMGLISGQYTVSVAQPAGTTPTDDPDGGNDNRSFLTLGSGESNAIQDFGYRGNGSIGDTVFFDIDNNATQNGGDRGVPSVNVTLDIDLNGDSLPDYIRTVLTNASGNYTFDNLIPGNYSVSVNPADLPDAMGGRPTFDADGIGTPHTSTYLLGVNENNVDQDFGYYAFPDYAIAKTDGLTSAAPGDAITYTIDVRNIGTLRGQNVVVGDTFPTNVLTNVTADHGGLVDPVSGTITWNLALLGMGQSELLIVTADVISPASPAINNFANSAIVSDDGFNGPDPDLSNNTDIDVDVLDAVPNLSVAKTNDLAAAAVPGQTFNYFVTVTNHGDQAATGVLVADNLPINVIESASVVTDDAANVLFDPASGSLTWTVGSLLGNGDSRTLTITVAMQDPVTALAAAFDNIATVTDDLTNGPDPDPSDNISIVSTILDATPDYVITKVDNLTRAAQPGDTFDYTLVVTNVGNQNGTGVVATDNLPIDIIDPNAVHTDDPANVVYDPLTGDLVWTIGDLNGRGAARSLKITVTVQQPLADPTLQSIPNTASVTDDGTNGPDFMPENNTTTISSDLLVYAFDSFNDFSGQHKNIDYRSVPFPTDPLLPRIPSDTIYSGTAEPGTTLRLTIHDQNDRQVGERTVVADVGGNWVASFPGTIIDMQAHSMEVQQTPASYNRLEDAGFNLRRYFHPAIHQPLFFSARPTVESVMRGQPHTVINTMHAANRSPLGDGWNPHAYELLCASTNAATR